MTNQPPTIKKMEKEFDNRFSAEWWKGFGTTDDIDKQGIEAIKSFFSSYLSEVLEYLQGEVKNVAGKKFPLGERKWCVECAQRIRKELNNKIKKLKGEE